MIGAEEGAFDTVVAICGEAFICKTDKTVFAVYGEPFVCKTDEIRVAWAEIESERKIEGTPPLAVPENGDVDVFVYGIEGGVEPGSEVGNDAFRMVGIGDVPVLFANQDEGACRDTACRLLCDA